MAHDNPNSGEPRPLTPSELGRGLGFSRQYASKKIKEGMPTVSVEAAKQWLVENAAYGVGYRSKGRAETATVPEPPAAELQPTATAAEKPAAPSLRKGSDNLSSLEESLQAAIRAEEESVRLLEEAQRDRNDKIIAVRLHAYNKAQVGRLAAEKLIQEIRERERILVPMDTAKSLLRKGFIAMVNRLRAAPKAWALAVNPSDDIHAESVLRTRIEALIAEIGSEFGSPEIPAL